MNGRILLLTDPQPDYGSDFLYDGFRSLGLDVRDFPSKASLHLPPGQEIGYDSELHWSATGEDSDPASERWDLVIVPSLRDGIRASLPMVRRMIKTGVLDQERVVLVDSEDMRREWYGEASRLLGFRPRFAYKRELYVSLRPWRLGYERFRSGRMRFPWDARWSLPLAYPGHRRVAPEAPRARCVYLNATVWSWAVNGIRGQLRRSLLHHPHVTVEERQVSVAENHLQNRSHRFAIVPAGGGYFCNRHWEVVADGCVPILERPPRGLVFQNAPREPEHCFYFSSVPGCLQAIERAASMSPSDWLAMSRRVQDLWLKYHTSERRAQKLWRDTEAMRGRLEARR